MKKEYIKISKYLSFILRHHPEKSGIELDSEGFTSIRRVLKILNKRYYNLNLGDITKETIQDIVNYTLPKGSGFVRSQVYQTKLGEI